MQKFIDFSVAELIKVIEIKPNSKKVAWQFILEELDAAKNGYDFIQDRIKSFFINKSDYIGAMDRSWDDVDGSEGPQQLLLSLLMVASEYFQKENLALLRITIVEYILYHYKFGKYYLDEQFFESRKPLFLFKIVVKDSKKLHPNFKRLLKDEAKPIRDVLCRWASGFEDRDNKLNYEFQTTFNSSFWEVYLYQCFKDLNLKVDFSQASPDFTLKSSRGDVFNVEAVTANHAYNTEPEWSKGDGNIKDHKKFLDFACIRILNSLKKKRELYLDKYSNYEHVKGNGVCQTSCHPLVKNYAASSSTSLSSFSGFNVTTPTALQF